MTSRKDLVDARQTYREEVAPVLEELISETMRTDGPINALAWVGTVAISFLLCLGLLLVVAGG